MPDPWSARARGGTAGEGRVEPLVTVITPTIEGRFDLLHEAMESVRRQTLKGVEHSILLDADGAGPAATRNLMLRAARTPYVAFLDDDDVLDPEHLELLLETLAETGRNVAYSYCRGFAVPRPRDERAVWRTMASGRNVIPVTVLAETSALIDVGGFDPEARYEDYDLWMRLRATGRRFACLQRETWTYRIQADSRTHA